MKRMKLSLLAIAAFMFTAGITLAQQGSKTIDDCWSNPLAIGVTPPNVDQQSECPGNTQECCYKLEPSEQNPNENELVTYYRIFTGR
ncbi:hypothetical protein [Pedobacter sp. ASV28]|uniref:hypothetical protein n=1 Tax=Pedobacter sp. ASV28 TaxID=2795123 RepID=UPI0018EA5DE8|nr:hypothetical protein [Pedobacter sp. ASV28]